MYPVRYELCFYIPEDDILHSYHRENLKSYIAFSFMFQQLKFLHKNNVKLCPQQAYTAFASMPHFVFSLPLFMNAASS
jgi:hypothetical protein